MRSSQTPDHVHPTVQDLASPSQKGAPSISQSFRYWRFRILYSLMFGYAAFYLVRQNLAIAIPQLSLEFGYSKAQLGMIGSSFAIIYGIGKAISGTFSDRSNARYFMSLGLFLSAVVCFATGFISHIYLFFLFWALNACFQSMGAPPCQRLLTHWFHPKEIATKWAIWNSSHQIGAALVTVGGGYLIMEWGWRSAFWIPGLITIFLAYALYNRLRDTPESLGLPSIEVHKEKKSASLILQEDNELTLSLREILVDRVLKNRLVWYMCWANMFFYVLRFGLLTWAPTFLIENKGSSLVGASWQTVGFDIAAIFGGIVAGYLSDRTFKGRRGPIAMIFMIFLMMFLLYLWQIPSGSDFQSSFVMVMIGFFVSGPQILQGVAAADFASKKAAGAANGLTGTFGYIGGSVAGVGIGVVVDHWGWNAAFIVFAIASLLSAFFFGLIWNYRSPVFGPHKAKKNLH